MHTWCTRHAGHPSLWRILDAALYASSQPLVGGLLDKVIAKLEADLRAAEAVSADDGTSAASSSSGSRLRQFTPADGDASAAPAVGLPGGGIVPALKRRAAPRLTMMQLRERTEAEARARVARMQQAAQEPVQPVPHAAAAGPAVVPDEASMDDDPYTRRRSVGSNMWRYRAPEVVAAAGEEDSRAIAGSEEAASEDPGHGRSPTRGLSPPPAAAAAVPRRWPPSEVAAIGGVGSSTRSAVVGLLTRALREGRDSDVQAQAQSRASVADSSRVQLASTAAKALSAATDALSSNGALSALAPPALFAIAGALEAALHRLLVVGTSLYSERARALVHALRDPRNASLRAGLLGGDTAPDFFATCASEELAPAQVRAQHAQLREPAVLESDGRPWIRASFSCDSCGATDSEWAAVVGQRDASKADIWGGGDGSAVFEVRCRECGATWQKDNV